MTYSRGTASECDADPFPPPPTPSSCPPSPSSTYFNPLPPPPSPNRHHWQRPNFVPFSLALSPVPLPSCSAFSGRVTSALSPRTAANRFIVYTTLYICVAIKCTTVLTLQAQAIFKLCSIALSCTHDFFHPYNYMDTPIYKCACLGVNAGIANIPIIMVLHSGGKSSFPHVNYCSNNAEFLRRVLRLRGVRAAGREHFRLRVYRSRKEILIRCD